MNQFLKRYYAESSPKTLCILQPLPGLSDEVCFPVISTMKSPEDSLKFVEEHHQKICSQGSSIPRRKLVSTEVYEQEDSLYEAIIVAYYEPVEDC